MQNPLSLELLGKARHTELLAQAEQERMIHAMRQAQPRLPWWLRLRSLNIVFAAAHPGGRRINRDDVCNGACASPMACCPAE